MKGLMVNGSKSSCSLGFTVTSTTLVSNTSSVLIHLTIYFSALPCKPSLSARLPATLKILEAVSYKTKALVSKPDELTKCNSDTWRSPLTSVTDDIVVVLLDGS